jgi:hypothetical protein
MLKVDPVIAQIRAARHLISARFNHDPKKIVEYYIQFQERYRQRLIDSAEIKDEYQKNSVNIETVAG